MEEEIKPPPTAGSRPEAGKDNQVGELEECKAKCGEYLNNWKRASADMANYKKEEIVRAGMLIGYAKEGVFSNILPVIDSIYLAATAFGKEGFTPIEKQIQEFLKKEGIEAIETIGQKFNPETMDIVAASAESSGEPNEEVVVVEELQKGYKMGDKVLRPAKVRVNK